MLKRNLLKSASLVAGALLGYGIALGAVRALAYIYDGAAFTTANHSEFHRVKESDPKRLIAGNSEFRGIRSDGSPYGARGASTGYKTANAIGANGTNTGASLAAGKTGSEHAGKDKPSAISEARSATKAFSVSGNLQRGVFSNEGLNGPVNLPGLMSPTTIDHILGCYRTNSVPSCAELLATNGLVDLLASDRTSLNPITVANNGAGEFESTTGGLGSFATYESDWSGGDFGVDATRTGADISASTDLELLTLSAAILDQMALDPMDRLDTPISDAGVVPADYENGLISDSGDDPGVAITSSEPVVGTAVPEPWSFAVMVGGLTGLWLSTRTSTARTRTRHPI